MSQTIPGLLRKRLPFSISGKQVDALPARGYGLSVAGQTTTISGTPNSPMKPQEVQASVTACTI